MQTSPLSPHPLRPRSGSVDGAPRSASAPTSIRLLIGGETDDGDEALRLLRCLRPDIALLDGDLPSFGGAAIARVLRSELPETRIVVMTRQPVPARP